MSEIHVAISMDVGVFGLPLPESAVLCCAIDAGTENAPFSPSSSSYLASTYNSACGRIIDLI